ncbi:hypothetical protein WG66_010712 [Moniliophthora roreri]|nr:hypothetical protein WG66_010712 [Moniliophthora roreri]
MTSMLTKGDQHLRTSTQFLDLLDPSLSMSEARVTAKSDTSFCKLAVTLRCSFQTAKTLSRLVLSKSWL